jgi:alcohol dehydrogenase (NADP+)
MIPTRAYAVHSATDRFQPFAFDRRAPNPNDVAIAIRYCGVCHSDLHTARGEWGGTRYPCVPGHEIVGEVTEVGSAVTRFRPGDLVGVGCMVDSCLRCEPCRDSLEQYCIPGFTGTYNGPTQETRDNTYGGYSDRIVVREEFVLHVRHRPEQLAAVAPLLCAGITTWSPLRHWHAGPGKTVGVVGIGGLGHMGLKLAHALGAHVIAFTTSPDKAAEAQRLGADEVVISRDEDQMKAQAGRIDLIVNTVAAPHPLDPFLMTLKRDGTMVLVGAPPEPHPSPTVGLLVFKRRSLAGSLIGGIAETQEMLDFCAEHDIVSDIEMIDIKAIDDAYRRMAEGDVKYRFVIDNQSLAAPA